MYTILYLKKIFINIFKNMKNIIAAKINKKFYNIKFI